MKQPPGREYHTHTCSMQSMQCTFYKPHVNGHMLYVTSCWNNFAKHYKNKTTLNPHLQCVLKCACRVIPLWRPICGLTKPYHHSRSKSGMCKDMLISTTFLTFWWHSRCCAHNEDLQRFTNSAAEKCVRFGILNLFSESEKYPDNCRSTATDAYITFFCYFIDFMEGDDIRNNIIFFRPNNMSAYHVINKMTPKSDLEKVILWNLTVLCFLEHEINL